ncbi:16S rRNA (adenine(1518)-N(6)/adenine(1519)-N(6))-dimethyltransferase [Patescibacteria group bacterium]|nr:16S rRNA (adenine(1518)-N(6)/adenine(1519)-N(6))-dimethyltransferase [Patescibacteria group bacterium]
MDLTNRNELKTLLDRHGLVLAKTYGQHFLVQRAVLEKIVGAAFPTGATALPVIEVGPGIGTLTRELARHAPEVIAIERDLRMRAVLAETLAGVPAVRIVEADALRISFTDAVSGMPYRVVSNLPYEISTPFLWKILHEEAVRPTTVTLLLQAEVVTRVLERTPHMNLLSLLVAFAGTARRVHAVSRNAFFPPPRVDSAVLHIEDITPAATASQVRALALARRAFAAPRKKMSSTLGVEAGHFGEQRPSVLTPEQWLSLADER